MQFWTNVLNIVVFLLCLSLVVCLHEAGHLAVAKLCNVYCFEYSIGFGPLLFKHKFKHKKKKNRKKEILEENLYVADDKKEEKVLGETQLSIRALPLGGYVAMAGEDGTLAEDGTVVPSERTLPGINHFKQICIMLAGICMNFLVAIVLFIVSSWLPQTQNVLTGNQIQVAKDTEKESYAANACGLQSGDQILTLYQTYDNLVNPETKEKVSLEFPALSDRAEMTDYQVFKEDSKKVSYNDVTNTSIAYASQDIYLNYKINVLSNGSPAFDLAQYDKTYGTEFSKYVANSESTRTFHITYKRGDEVKSVISKPIKAVENNEYFVFEKFGISCMTKQYNPTFSEAFVNGNKTFGNLFVNIYQAIGSLFTPSGWKNVGGIISVYKMSAQGTQSGSISYFLLLWGYISLNLGCFNLLPFPGLDGWQTLMALYESISRRKVSTKFKSVANTVGLIIMFALAALLIVKDIVAGSF